MPDDNDDKKRRRKDRERRSKNENFIEISNNVKILEERVNVLEKDKERKVLPIQDSDKISIVHFKGVKQHWKHPLYLDSHGKIVKKIYYNNSSL